MSLKAPNRRDADAHALRQSGAFPESIFVLAICFCVAFLGAILIALMVFSASFLQSWDLQTQEKHGLIH